MTWRIEGHLDLQELAGKFGEQSLVGVCNYYNYNCYVPRIEKFGLKRYPGKNWNELHPNWCGFKYCGEIFMNSCASDGLMEGIDMGYLTPIIREMLSKKPLIMGGGVGKPEHFKAAFDNGADAVAASSIFAYTEHTTTTIANYLDEQGIPVRLDGQRFSGAAAQA